MTTKNGGDVFQKNDGTQFNASAQDLKAVSNVGPAVLDSFGGKSFLSQAGVQDTDQHQDQHNFGIGGDGGNDNIFADTTIAIR